MTEANCLRALANGLRSQGCWAYKIPDIAKGAIKPFDLIVAHEFMFFAIEAKLKKLKRKKPITDQDVVINQLDFRPHQLPTLNELNTRRWAMGYVAAFLNRVADGGTIEAYGWLIPIWLFVERQFWTVEQLKSARHAVQLQWAPSIGWLLPELFLENFQKRVIDHPREGN